MVKYLPQQYHQFNKSNFFIKLFPILSIGIGLMIIVWISYPILTFKIFYEQKYKKIIRPIPSDKPISTIDNIASNLNQKYVNVDYTKASVWFPKATQKIKVVNSNKSYKLSIPKLKIENADVSTDGDDLTKSLIQYTGPLPGNFGNPVIFGHSTIPFLYNPKNYKTIFSKLPDLLINDIILIKIDEITYTYKIIDMKITSPDDLSVLDQDYQDNYLTLITCVPPGTYLERLIVKAKLVNI